MTKFNLHVPIFEWDVTFLFTNGKKDVPFVNRYIQQFMPKLDSASVADLLNHLENEDVNGGTTYTSMTTKKAVILVLKCTDEWFLFNVINHEKRHCIDNIIESCHIKDRETSAYLDGYVSAELYKQLNKIMKK